MAQEVKGWLYTCEDQTLEPQNPPGSPVEWRPISNPVAQEPETENPEPDRLIKLVSPEFSGRPFFNI